VRLTGSRRLVVEAVGVAAGVLVVHLLFRLSALFPFGVYDDDGVYVALGKAIAQGAGYRSIHLVGAPLQLRYPPGLPLVLSIPWALGGSLEAVRATVAVVHVLVTAGAAGLIWWIGRRDLNLSPLPLAVCAVSPFVLDATIQFFNLPLSEPYFALGWAGALALVPGLLRAETAGAPQAGRALALGLVLAGTTLFRAAGIALLPAILAVLLWRRRWPSAAVCAAASLVPLLAWAGLRATWAARGPVSTVPDDLGYWRWLGADGPLAVVAVGARAVATNTLSYLREFSSLMFSLRPVGFIVLGAAVIAAAAACVRLRTVHAPLVLTALCATALTLLWPFGQGRLVLPLLPFVGLLTASTADLGVRSSTPGAAWGVSAILAAIAIAVTLRQVDLRATAARAFQSGVFPPPEDRSPTLTLAFRSRFIFQVADWVRQHTDVRDRVMVQAPAAVFLYTGRRTVSAIPSESGFGPSVFAVPGRYLAQRILADSLSVAVWTPATAALGRDIEAVRAGCPQDLVAASPSLQPPVYYRVIRDERCLRKLATGPLP
jgi:hypothetical protein